MISDQIHRTTPEAHPQPDTLQGWIKELQTDQQGYNKGFSGGRFQQDLTAANNWMHDHGFGNFQLTGIRGDQLVGVENGQYQTVTGNAVRVDTGSTAGDFKPTTTGHEARLNPDGSGQYRVGQNDKAGWDLARDMLKDRGIDSPSATQIANFERDLLRANGQNPTNLDWFKHLRAGQAINVPAGGADQPHVETPPAAPGVPSETPPPGVTPDQRAQDQQLAERLEDARLAHYLDGGLSGNLTRDDLQKRLAAIAPGDQSHAQELAGLQFLLTNFDKIGESGAKYLTGEQIAKFAETQEQEIRRRSGVVAPSYQQSPEFSLPITPIAGYG